jgi:hypothetical protein
MPLLTPLFVSIHSIYPLISWSLHQDISTKPDRRLTDSITHFGLMRPPIVRPNQEGYELICGARRLNALKLSQPSPTIACLLVDENADADDVLQLVAEDQLQSGPLSPIEAARFIALCQQRCQRPDAQLLNRATATTSTLQRQRLVTLLELEEPIRLSIHQDKISAQTGFFLVKLSQAERLFVFELFTRLSLNNNKQRQFLELARILTAGQGCTIERFMTEHFPEFCRGGVDNVPQHTHRLMQQLHQRSHPDSSRAKEQFSKKVAEKNLPKNCRVLPSPAFENDKVTLEVEFSDFDSFSKAWDKIKGSI